LAAEEEEGREEEVPREEGQAEDVDAREGRGRRAGGRKGWRRLLAEAARHKRLARDE
jgi:hypothetical protein